MAGEYMCITDFFEQLYKNDKFCWPLHHTWLGTTDITDLKKVCHLIFFQYCAYSGLWLFTVKSLVFTGFARIDSVHNKWTSKQVVYICGWVGGGGGSGQIGFKFFSNQY
jgi:hypothetical protein